MTTIRVVGWTMTSGKRCEIKIEVSRKMVANGTAYADGWNVKLTGKHLVESQTVVACVDGVEIERAECGQIQHIKAIDVQGLRIVAVVAAKVALTEERVQMIDTAIREAIVEAETEPEVAEYRQAERKALEADIEYDKHVANVESMMTLDGHTY